MGKETETWERELRHLRTHLDDAEDALRAGDVSVFEGAVGRVAEIATGMKIALEPGSDTRERLEADLDR